MKLAIKNIIVLIIVVLVTASITAFAVFRASANNISFSSDKTDKDNVEESLNELYDLSETCGGTSWCPDVEYPTCADGCLSNMYCLKSLNIPDTTKKCKRAKNLHVEICSQTDTTSYCSSIVTSANGSDVFNGSSLIYGNKTITEGELHTGDAFTCDVNGDGYYDEITERFYYVSDYYDGTTDTFDTNYATLIYYNNTVAGTPNNTSASSIAYHSSNVNNSGPATGIANLPSTSQWKSVRLKSVTRQIRNQTGTMSTTSGTIQTFTYTDKAARLITAQELNSACEITVGSITNGEIDTPTCRFLLENTKYSNASSTVGYWIETPHSSIASRIWYMDGDGRYIHYDPANRPDRRGVRPAIEVLKTDIAY